LQYEVVFDLAEIGYRQWWFPAFGLLFVVVGGILVKFRATVQKWRMPTLLAKSFPFIVLGFSILWTLASFALTFGEYYSLKRALQEGRYRVVEGPVTEFQPMPYSGHARESFVVGGNKFSYSDFEMTSAFNNTQSHGGPIKEGLYIRVTSVGDAIVKLEIRR